MNWILKLRYLLRSLLATAVLMVATSTGLQAQTQELTREQILQGNWGHPAVPTQGGGVDRRIPLRDSMINR